MLLISVPDIADDFERASDIIINLDDLSTVHQWDTPQDDHVASVLNIVMKSFELDITIPCATHAAASHVMSLIKHGRDVRFEDTGFPLTQSSFGAMS